MKLLEPYCGKEEKPYTCSKCKERVCYAKVADDEGTFYTEDGNLPNGKFGKESNVLSAQVDFAVQDRVHKCAEGFVNKAVKEAREKRNPVTQQTIDSPAQGQKNQNYTASFDPERFTVPDQVLSEIYNKIDEKMSFMIPAYHRILTNLKHAGIENPNPALVGMFFNNLKGGLGD
jgi:hypothetical protein